MQNPKILILDEATSALDNTTEKKIQIAFSRLMRGRTTIIIAHRLSTIQYVDRICVMEHGNIVEMGTYGTLIGQGGKFSELANPSHLMIA